MFKPVVHTLIALGLLLSACSPQPPQPTATLPPPVATSTPIARPSATPEASGLIEPALLSHTSTPDAAGLRRPEIVLHFNKAMDEASVAAALYIKPAVPFSREWSSDSRDLRLTADEPLAPATSVSFRLDRKAHDAQGQPLPREVYWKYSLPPLIIDEHVPDLPGPTAPIILSFHYALQEWSVERSFALEPQTPGTTVYDPDTRTLTFTPAITLSADTPYTWRFNKPLWDVSSQLIESNVTSGFRTLTLATIEPAQGDYASISNGIVVSFSQEVNAETAEAAFSLAPATPGTFEWRDSRTMVFMPESGFLERETAYTVTLATSLRLLDGRSGLRTPLSHTFTTRWGQFTGNFGVGALGQVIDADGRRAVQFAFDAEANRVDAQFTLRAVPLEDFVRNAGQVETLWDGSRQEHPNLDRYAVVSTWTYGADAQPSRKDDEWSGRRLETLIPADVPPGLYVLELKAGNDTDALWVALTRAAVQARRSDDQVLAWVTDINGSPIGNATVSVLTSDAQTLASGGTNADGLIKLDVSAAQAAWVVADIQGDRTVTALSSGWQSFVPGLSPSTGSLGKQAVFITTDRPIYRPGDTVRFKAILRHDDDGNLTVEPEREVIVKMHDARDNVVRTIYLRTDAFGSVDSLFRIAEGATTGEYAIEVQIDGETHRQTFEVEDYNKPEIDVQLTTDGSAYSTAQTIHGTVDTRYFFDTPVVNANVSIQFFDVYEYCDWSDECYSQAWYPQDKADITGKTDSTGRFVFTTKAATSYFDWYGMDSAASARIGIEATVTDDSNLPVSAHQIVTVYQSQRRLEWLSGHGLYRPGENATLRLSVTDLAGAAVVGQRTRLEARRWNERSLDYSDVFWKSDVVSDKTGIVEASLPLEEPGYYQLVARASDPDGRSVTVETWLWAYAAAAAYPQQAGSFGVEADREAYAPGDVAVLTIWSDFSGPALVSIGRTGLLREQIVTLHSPITSVEVPIQSGDAPNLNVSISAWRTPLDSNGQPLAFDPDTMHHSLPDSALMSAGIMLNVPPVDKQLTIEVHADRESYSAGEQATFDFVVNDAAGQPVQAQIALALVDEAIFRLSEENSGPIFDAFYFPRAKKVGEFNSYEPSRWISVYNECECGGGGGGGEGPGLEPRNDFEDTALWSPVILTDSEGHASVTVTLPDNLTTWRLTARAVTASTQVGEVTTRIITQKDIIVRPVLPTTLTAGDDVDLTVIVHNNTAVTRTFDVGMTATPGFQLRDALIRTVTAAANSTVVVGWRARALEAGDRTLTFRAVDPTDRELSDAVELPVNVKALATVDQTTRLAEVHGTETWNVTVPSGLLAQSSVDLTLSASIAGNVTDGLEYLTGYPYGCVEQTMSRALPNAVVARAFRELRLDDALDRSEMARKIDASVQRLYGFQHEDGGWGWWTDDDTNDYQTAWVIFGLTQTRAAGYEVDPAVIERGAKYLAGRIGDLDSHTRAFALYSLALAGYGDLTATQAAAKDDADLDAFSQANLALALHILGDEDGALGRLAILTDSVRRQEGRAYWLAADEDGHYYQKTMASTTRSTALALSAYIALDPNSPLVAESVRYLMDHRRPEGWGSTNETSFTILALTDYLLLRAGQIGSTSFAVSINGVKVSSGTLNAERLSTRVSLPLAAFRPGVNTLSITTPSTQPLYLTATQRWYSATTRVERDGAIDIERQYSEAGSNSPLVMFNAGDVVRVSLTVDLPQTGSFMLIEDAIPGGLEPINERLNSSSFDSQLLTGCYWSGECSFYRWEEYGYNQKEIRSDRVSFFVTTLTAGRHIFTYLARAVRTGRFTALPATASAMYDETLWGRSKTATVFIEP